MSSANVPGSVGGDTRWAHFVEPMEGYGSEIIDLFVRSLPEVRTAVDIGAGGGRDLSIVRKHFPQAHLSAIDFNRQASLLTVADAIHTLDVERAPLPFADLSMDLVIANQVLEHLKEIFWVWHEVSRTLKVGGHFLVGVPNIASFHNRILLALGRHPTQWKSYSAHVRPFSRRDTVRFADVCFPDGYELVAHRGAQFHPFPVWLSRPMCAVFPDCASSIFMLFRKTKTYRREFLEHPVRARLETNFFLG